MKDERTNGYSLLFRVDHDGDIYSIPIQYITRVEPSARRTASIPRTPEHIAGVYQLHGKNVSIVDLGYLLGLKCTSNSSRPEQGLLIIVNAKVGFLVETILGVKPLHSRQRSGSISQRLIQTVHLYDGWDELILELNIPHLLSICG